MNRTTRSVLTATAAAVAALSLAACGGADEATSEGSSPTSSAGTAAAPEDGETISNTSPADGGEDEAEESGSAPAPATETARKASSDEGASGAEAPKGEGTAPSDASAAKEPATAAPAPSTAAADTDPNLTTRSSRALFVSPSGNISCDMTAMGSAIVRCDLVGATFDVPEDIAADCQFDTGTSMVVDGKGARVGCVSDVVAVEQATSENASWWWKEAYGTAGGGQPVLPYGSNMTVAEANCASSQQHVKCTVGNHGFTISSGGYTTF